MKSKDMLIFLSFRGKIAAKGCKSLGTHKDDLTRFVCIYQKNVSEIINTSPADIKTKALLPEFAKEHAIYESQWRIGPQHHLTAVGAVARKM